MLNEEQFLEWLVKKNENYRRSDILPKQRPFLALRDLAKEFNTPIHLGSELANKVFSWFEVNTKPGSHAIGPLFTGVFYFDACFWPISIPVGYGQFKLNSLASLETMSDKIKASSSKTKTN